MSVSGTLLAADERNSTVFTDSAEMGSGSQNPTLLFSDTALIIPAVVCGLLIVVVIIYYLWTCWEEYNEGKEAEKAASVEAPIAEPENFTPVVPVENADADGTDGDVEDAT